MRMKTKKEKVESSEEIKDVSNEVVAEEIKEITPSEELTQVALGIWHNTKTNSFHLIKIKYDPISKKSGEMEIGEGYSKIESEYYFKITAGGEIM